MRSFAALVPVAALAASLRVWGIDYGIPHPTARPDEERVVGRAQTIFATGDWHPGSFYYPSLPFYVDALALHGYYRAKRLLGDYERPFDFLFDAAVTRPGLHYRVARWVSAAAGVLTVFAAFALSRAAFGRTGAALLAALALAVSHLHVRDSHFATVDVLTTLFVTASLAFAVRSDLALAGLFAGLAVSSKYNAGVVLLAIAAAALLGRKERFTRLALAAAVALVAFAATSPYVLLRFGAFWSDMDFLREFLYRSTRGELALWDHLSLTLPYGLGWPLFLAGALGVLRALWLRRPADLVLLAFALPFFLLVSSVRITFPRYVLPLLPVLAVFAADFVAWILERVPAGKARVAAGVVLTLSLVAPTLSSSIAFDRIAARSDTRLQAAAFLSEFFVPRTPIVVCRGYGAPAVNEDRRRPPAFVIEEMDCLSGALPPGAARFLLTHEHEELSSFSRLHPELEAWLEENAELVSRFDPYRRRSREKPRFFPADAFYVPFAGLDGVERGGPVVKIWKLGDDPGR